MVDDGQAKANHFAKANVTHVHVRLQDPSLQSKLDTVAQIFKIREVYIIKKNDTNNRTMPWLFIYTTFVVTILARNHFSFSTSSIESSSLRDSTSFPAIFKRSSVMIESRRTTRAKYPAESLREMDAL